MNLIGLDGQRIIIFGGTTSLNFNPFVTVDESDSIYSLDLTNFAWSVPKISGPVPKARMLHGANVIGKYMVISFGKYMNLIYNTQN